MTLKAGLPLRHMTTQIAAELAAAARKRDGNLLGEAIVRIGRRVNHEALQTAFRETVPLLLGPSDLLWLLKEISFTASAFEEKRDVMIDTFSAELAENGLIPGKDFSAGPDPDSGRAIFLTAKGWQSVKPSLDTRAIQHYRCFVRTPLPSGDGVQFADA